MKRELKEEFGIETIVGSFFGESVHNYSFGTIRLIGYRTEYLSGEFVLNAHYSSKWVLPIEMRNYIFCPADEPFVEKLNRK